MLNKIMQLLFSKLKTGLTFLGISIQLTSAGTIPIQMKLHVNNFVSTFSMFLAMIQLLYGPKFNHLLILNLSANNITNIEGSAFLMMNNLQNLDISLNQIFSFVCLNKTKRSQLQYIKLSRNYSSEIELSRMKGNKDFFALDLKGHKDTKSLNDIGLLFKVQFVIRYHLNLIDPKRINQKKVMGKLQNKFTESEISFQQSYDFQLF